MSYWCLLSPILCVFIAVTAGLSTGKPHHTSASALISLHMAPAYSHLTFDKASSWQMSHEEPPCYQLKAYKNQNFCKQVHDKNMIKNEI